MKNSTFKYVLPAVLIVLGCTAVFYGGFLDRSRSSTDVGTPKPVTDATDSMSAKSAGKPVTPDLPTKQSKVDLPLTSRFNAATDLAQFVAENSNQAKSGDAKAAHYIAQAYRDCMPYGTNPSDFVASKEKAMAALLAHNPDNKRFRELLQTEAARCLNLNQQAGRQDALTSWISIAAKEGDPSSKIMAFSLPNAAPPTATDVRGIASEIFASKDGEALAAFGGLVSLGDGQSDQSIYGKYSGDPNASYAFNLAACELGMDCSQNGPSLTAMCLRSGFCNFATLEDAYANILSPIQMQSTLKMRGEILTAIQHNDVSSLYQ